MVFNGKLGEVPAFFLCLAIDFVINNIEARSQCLHSAIDCRRIQTCYVFRRLLQTCDVINRHLSVQQTVVNMTSSQAPQHLKPARVAPPIPKQARPLPPSPIPEHANDGVIVPLMTSSPPKPLRSKSLLSSYLDCDDGFLHLSDSSIFLCSSGE